MVNEILEGEMNSFMEEEKASGSTNRRNGRGTKQVLTNTGKI